MLASHQDYKRPETWTAEVLSTIDASLGAFGPVTPRQATTADPLPYRGGGVRPDGSVSLAISTRYTAGGGKQYAPSAVESGSLWLWDGAFRTDGPPTLDTLTLPAKEWAAFAPPATAAGAEWSLPEAVARKLARALSPSSDQSTMPRPEEAKVAELKERMEPDARHIRLTGRWEADHLYDGKTSRAWATAEGLATWDPARKSLRDLLLVFRGAYRMAPPWDKETRPTGAVVEWKASGGR